MHNILVTGGAGYLGRAYLRWASEHQPDFRFTIFSRDEAKHARCRREFSDPGHYRYIVGDICDSQTVDLVVAGHDTIIHAAAFKYVPQGETNGIECTSINYAGSISVARAAIRHGVERVIGISTDKACSPINNYGTSKLMMERAFQELDTRTECTRFNLVRYGNVISSTGSVIPVFQEQLKRQGFISLTDPLMTRFWLSVSGAVDLINLALLEDFGGTILIPRCPSISMQALADSVVQNQEQIRVVGMRFGEKRHESLLNEVEGHYADRVTDRLMRLWPTVSASVHDPVPAYSSDHPDHMLTVVELQQMIDEAPERSLVTM